MTNYSRSVLKLNGFHHPKNLSVKFGFSPKTVPANIVKKLPAQRCSKPLFIAFFSLSHKRPTFAFTGESEYTLGFANRIAHSGLHGETGSVSGGGRYLHPRSVPRVLKTLRGQGLKRQTLPLLGLGRRRSRRTQRASGQRCAYARRCPEASRPRRAAHTYAVNTSIFPAEFFSHSQKAGKKSHSLMFHIHVFDCTA